LLTVISRIKTLIKSQKFKFQKICGISQVQLQEYIPLELYKEARCQKHVAQVFKPIELTLLSIIMVIGIIALTTELTEYEELAKVVVIPSLILLILVTGYGMFKTVYVSR
jgi:uncharacterized membrane-anchored protein